MIDPDINEQMARYAPSQRPPRLDRLATDIMAAGPYRPVEVRDPIADSIVDDRQDTLAASLLEASKTNPDEAARALQLARDNNVGTDIALRNMNALAQQARIAQVQDLELPKRNPILSRMLEDREFARVAQDDIKNLNDTGSVFRDFVTGNFGSFSTLGELATGATRARLTTKRGQLSVEAMTRDLTPFEEQELVTIEKELEKVSEIGFLRGAAEQVSYLYESVPYIVGGVAKGAVAGAVAGAAGGPLAELTVPAGTIIGSGFGAQYGIGEFTYVVEAGNAYRDMVVEGRDVIKQRLDAGEIDQAGYDQQMYEMESSARSIATGVGLANAVLEVGAVKLALAPFRAAFAPVLRQAFGGAIKDVTRREAFKILGFEFMKQVGGQGATELVQEVNIMIGEDLQRAYGSKLPTKMSTPEGREEVAQRLIDTFEHAVVGFTILGTFGPTAQYYSNVRRAESALQTRQFFSTLSEQAKAGNLMTRSPEMYQRVIAGYANGTDAETTYINGRELNSVLQQLAIPREEFANRFPDVARQLDQAMELDQDVTLPTAEFAAKMSTTNLGQALLQHVRVDPRAMSPKMAEEFLAQRPQLLQEAREMYQQKESADQEFVASGRRVEQAITADLEATGQYKNKADVRAVAQVARDMYTALAKRTNTTPEAVYEQYRNRVQLAPAQAAQAQAQAQALQTTTRTTEQYEQAERIDISEDIRAAMKQRDTVAQEARAKYRGKPDGRRRGNQAAESARQRWNRENPELARKIQDAQAPQVAALRAREQQRAAEDSAAAQVESNARATVLKQVEDRLAAAGFTLEYISDSGSRYYSHDRLLEGRTIRVSDHSLPSGNPSGFVYTNEDRYNTARPEVLNDLDEWIAENIEQRPLEQASRLDADYMAAVERGDMDTAQRMVDEAAKAAGYTIPVYHFTDETFTAFDVQRGKAGPGIWLTSSPTGWFGKNRLNLYLNPGKIENVKTQWDETWREGELSIEGILEGDLKTMSSRNIETLRNAGDYYSTFYVATRPEQVKSADPVTYDDAGNVVPLSRRFDITSPKIFEQAARPTRNLGPIEAAKAIVQETGREAFTDADEFFKKRWDALLKKTKRQVKPSPRNFREAAKRAVADILDFVKNNPKFADYYANDWKATRSILDDYIGRAITDDEFAMFRTIAGLTSPNTMLPANISDTVGLWDHWMREGNFDAFTLGPKPGTGALVVFEAAEPISGTTANVKVRTIRIIERLIKERGGVTQALEYLQEGVPVKELHKFNRKMGYSGAVGDIGNISDLVQQATGQSKLIPRMFIFGQKVGAYTLNAIGDERYTTVDIWESRYIRSHFTGMFDVNIGLPESIDEHQIFTRFGDLFKEEMEAVTGRKWAPSALQALRWFYIIGSAREAGYSKASTNETISFYTERRLVQAFGYPGRAATSGGPSVGTAALGGAAGQVRAARIPPKRFERNLETDVAKLDNPDQRRRAIAAGYVRYARYNSELGQRGFSFDERRGGPARQHGILNATIAADFVPGERLQSAFGKANLPLQTMHELVADADGAQAFRALVAATNASNPYGAAVAVYTAEEYQGKRLFVTEDATAGFALSADGDIVSVFSAPKSGNGRAVMALSVQVGGRRLDCFDTALPGYYAAHGFRAVARLAWNDEYAPTGWNKDTFKDFNDGRPDVVFMVYERGYNGEYKAGDGAKAGDYDAGLQAQARALQAIAKSQQFQQAARGQARGWFDPITFITTLTSQADQTTFLHELAHFYLSVLMDVATTANPPAEITADLDNLFQWFGIDGATQEDRFNNWLNLSFEQQRKYHEQFAYSFEIYLFENKAPSIELRGAFARFASWFRQVYRNIRDELNAIYREQFGTDLPILTPEIRSVMDRMLADEDQIARQAAVNDVKAYYQTQEESGMDDATWLAYQMMAQETIDEAVAELTAKSLRNMQWLDNAKSAYIKNLQKKNAALRAEVREEVEAELELQRQYRTMQYLKRGVLVDVNGGEQAVQGPHKLDSAELKQSYDSLPESQRPNYLLLGTGRYGMIGKDGVSAEVVANLFGYGSGDEMIRDLLATKPLKDAIEERTDAVMLERYGDLQDPKSMERAANAALQNDARARFLAVELRNEAKATQPARFFVEAAKQAAEEFLANKKLKNLRPIEFVQAESRNAKDAQDALRMKTAPMKSGQAVYTSVYEAEIAAGVDEATAQATAQAARDAYQAEQTAKREAAFMARFGNVTPTEAIIRAKRAQLFNNQLARQGYDIQDQVRADVKYMRRVLRPENVAKMDASFVDQLQHLLTRFNLATMTQKQLEDHTNIVQWMVGQEEAGVVFDFAPGLINPNRATPYQNLTVQEFRDLVDAVKQIEYVGKNERKVWLAGEKVAYGVKRDQIVAAIRANWKGKVGIKRQPITPAERRMDAMKRYFYDHLKAASVARIMDGGQDGGPMWEYLIRSANEAGDMETTMRAKATKELTEILKPSFARGKMGGTGTFFPSINRSMNREARLVVALNMGNAGNIQRMLDGEGWTMEQVMPILNSMTEAELLAVQAVWDYLESFRPLVGAKARRINGQEPKWVEPQPMIVKSADGKSVTLRGGYYPIVYDRYASFRVDARKEQELAREQLRATFTAATTRRTHTKARVKQVIGQPIVYSLAGLYNGVNDVIHDLSWHEWLIQANRLMRDPIVLSAIRETYGPQAHALLKDWIDSNAEGERGANSGTEGIVNMMRHNISVTGLGFSVLSAASQITGFANSFVRVGGGDVTVGAKWVGRGIAAYTANPARASARVRESSEFMANRARTQWRELNEIRNQVQGESMFRRGLRANSYVLMTFMQGVVDIPTWMGAYEKAIDGGFDDETAIALADQAVIDSQGSGMLKDLAQVERGGPMMKLFTVFYSYMNVVYNQAAVSTMTAKSRAKYIADMLTLLTVPVVLNYGLRSALTPNAEDDEEGFEAIARDLIAEQLSYLMGTMVIVREAAFVSDIVAGKESPRRGYEGPAGLRLINETGRFVTQSKQGEFDRAFRKSLINMLGVMFGLPSAQINRTVDGLEAIGEEEVTGPEAALAPLTGVER